MNKQDVLGAKLHPHLPDRLQKRQRLDVTHGAADLDYGHVGLTGSRLDAAFDLIGNVGNHLHGSAQIVAAAFFAKDVLVHLTGGKAVIPTHLGAHEAFVMTQVQIGLRAIVGDEHLSVLKRAHGAGVHVKVGVRAWSALP